MIRQALESWLHISTMRISFVFLTALSLSLSQRTRARLFILEDQWRGDDFFRRGWNWETENDPTHGRVNYVSQAEAISKNLAYSMFCPQVASSLVVVRVVMEPNFQRRTDISSSCVPTVSSSSTHLRVGATAYASRHRMRMTRR